MSDVEIEERARILRRNLGVTDEPAFNIVEILRQKLPDVVHGFRLQAFSDKNNPNVLIYSQRVPPKIFAKQEIIDRAYRDDPWSRYALVHELAHLFLSNSNRSQNYMSARQRRINLGNRSQLMMNIEVSAQKFAMAFLIPGYLVKRTDNPHTISLRFKVDLGMAELRMKILFDRSRRREAVVRGFAELLDRLSREK